MEKKSPDSSSSSNGNSSSDEEVKDILKHAEENRMNLLSTEKLPASGSSIAEDSNPNSEHSSSSGSYFAESSTSSNPSEAKSSSGNSDRPIIKPVALSAADAQRLIKRESVLESEAMETESQDPKESDLTSPKRSGTKRDLQSLSSNNTPPSGEKSAAKRPCTEPRTPNPILVEMNCRSSQTNDEYMICAICHNKLRGTLAHRTVLVGQRVTPINRPISRTVVKGSAQTSRTNPTMALFEETVSNITYLVSIYERGPTKPMSPPTDELDQNMGSRSDYVPNPDLIIDTDISMYDDNTNMGMAAAVEERPPGRSNITEQRRAAMQDDDRLSQPSTSTSSGSSPPVIVSGSDPTPVIRELLRISRSIMTEVSRIVNADTNYAKPDMPDFAIREIEREATLLLDTIPKLEEIDDQEEAEEIRKRVERLMELVTTLKGLDTQFKTFDGTF